MAVKIREEGKKVCVWGGGGGGIRDREREYNKNIVQELCESRGGRPGLSVLSSLPVSVYVKIY